MGVITKNETMFWQYRNKDGTPIFQLTSNDARTRYYLYEAEPDGGWRKLGSAKTPPEPEKKYNVVEKMFE